MNYSSPDSHLHPSTFSSPSRQNNLSQLEGNLYAKQGASMTWKSQYLQATPPNLYIYEQKGGKLLFTLNLQDYQVLWHGQLQEKHTFVLKNKGERIKDIRWLYIGADSETTSRNWYHFFLSIADHQVSQINGVSGPIGDVPVTDMMITDAFDTKRYSEKNRMSHISGRSGNSGAHNYSPDIWKSPTKTVEKNNNGNLWHSNQGPSDTKIRGGNSDGANNGEFALPEEAPVWVEKIFQENIINNAIWKDVGEMTIIGGKWKGLEQQSSKMTICQYKDDAQLFRAEFKFEKVSAEKVFKVMLDVENKKKWDDSLDNLKVLFYAPTTKQAVVQEIHKSEGLFERKREFVYTRYVFKSQNSYFIVQQSLKDSAITTGFSKPLKIASCRGTINYFILQVVEKNRSVYVSLLTKQTNGGLITASQDTKLTSKRLHNIKEIEKILHSISETAASDVTIVPSPEREKGKKSNKFVVNEELIRNGFDSQEDNYWRKKEAAAPEKEKEKEKGSSYVRPIEIDIPRSRQVINLSSARMISEEENLRDEDINEKMLTTSQKKRPGPDPLEIDLSGHSLEEARSFTRSPVPVIEEDYIDENQPLNPVEDDASLMNLLEKMKRNEHVMECIDKRVRRKGLSRKQKEAKIPDINGDFMCATSWKRDPNGGLEFIDQEVIKRQKQVVLSLLQTMGRNIMEGKSLANMSLPIIINGKQTILHRAAMNCAYAPVYLPIAAEKRNPLEAFKQVLTFFFTSHHVGISQEKPFNPILGETYQGFLGGIPVDCEQISHHPPISTVYMRTDKFILQSNFRLEVVLGGPNSAKGLLLGNICVKLPDIGVEVHGLYPPGVSTGTTMGKRLFYFVDKLRAYDPKHNFYAELVFNPDDKGMIGNFFSAKSVEIDKVIGTIYKLKPEAMQEFVALKPKGDTKWPFDPKHHAVEELSKVDGKWTKYLKFDGRTYWEDHEVRPYMLIDKPNKVLPSDCQFREDLIWRKMNNFDKGQLMKEQLEEKQRNDRKLRAAHSKGSNKH